MMHTLDKMTRRIYFAVDIILSLSSTLLFWCIFIPIYGHVGVFTEITRVFHKKKYFFLQSNDESKYVPNKDIFKII